MVVVHCGTDENSTECLVGFVVPKRAIPHATARNRVKRQLRHLMRSRLTSMPQGGRVVIRVQTGAQGQDSKHLACSLDSALARARAKLAGR